MNTTQFELMSMGSEFESPYEEQERGYWRSGRGGGGSASRGGLAPRRKPPRHRPPQPIWPQQRPFGLRPWTPWAAVGPGFDSTDPLVRRCMQDCLQPQAAARPEPEPDTPTGAEPDVAADAPNEEMTMHRLSCNCPQCRHSPSAFELMELEMPASANRADEVFESGGGAFEGEGEGEGEFEDATSEANLGEALFSEAEEVALAAELLSVSNEAELEQFLGKLWGGIQRAGGAIGKAAKPLAGVLRTVAKTALPFVGGALGSLVPIPGVGTALGTALGSAMSQALEAEFGEMELEDREFESARSFVRIAGTTAQQLAQHDPGRAAVSGAAATAAMAAAARQHLPHFQPLRQPQQPSSGRWTRHGNTLIVSGA